MTVYKPIIDKSPESIETSDSSLNLSDGQGQTQLQNLSLGDKTPNHEPCMDVYF